MSHLQHSELCVLSSDGAAPSHWPDMDPEVLQTLPPVRNRGREQRHITFIRGASGSRGTSGLQRRIHQTGVPCARGAQARAHPAASAPGASASAVRRPQPPRRPRRAPAPPPPPPPRRPRGSPVSPSPARAAHAELPPRARAHHRPPALARAPSPGRRAQPAACWRPCGGPGHGERARGGGRPGGWLRRVPRAAERRRLPRLPQARSAARTETMNAPGRARPQPSRVPGTAELAEPPVPSSCFARDRDKARSRISRRTAEAVRRRWDSGPQDPDSVPSKPPAKPTATGPLPPTWERPRKRLPWLNLAEGSASFLDLAQFSCIDLPLNSLEMEVPVR